MTADPKFGATFGEESHGAGGYAIFNQLVQKLNAVVQSNPEARQNSPGTETDGTHYIVGDTPGGDWSSFSTDDLAIFFTGASATGWIAITPQEGWLAYVKDEDLWYMFDGSAWEVFPNTSIRLGDTKQLQLDSDNTARIESSDGTDIALTVSSKNNWTFTHTLGLRFIKRTAGAPVQMQIQNTTDTAYSGTADFTTITGTILAESGATPPMPDLPSGYSNTNPGYVKGFNGTAEIAFPFVSLA
jgi:hypothetical protein